jgi:hypothetical protein
MPFRLRFSKDLLDKLQLPCRSSIKTKLFHSFLFSFCEFSQAEVKCFHIVELTSTHLLGIKGASFQLPFLGGTNMQSP